jgi:steroid delta-isomerase-like uncharacterized protein
MGIETKGEMGMKPTNVKSTLATLIVMLIIVMVLGGMAIAKSVSKTDANIELVRKHHEEVWSKGTLVVADKIYSNEIVRHSADQPDMQGREPYKQFMMGTRGAFPDWKETVENVIASGDLVATKVSITATMTGALRKPEGTLPPTGKRLEVPCAVFFRIANGKIVEIWGYYDSLPFLKALGVLPPPPPK